MKRFLALSLVFALVIGVSMFCGPSSALAQNSIIIGGCGFPLASDCATPDDTSTVTSLSMTANPNTGVIKAVCHGTTTTRPTKATKCSGEALNTGGSPETSPTAPCAVQVAEFNNSVSQETDDWTETVTPSGRITLVCTFNQNEKGQ